MFCFFSRIPSSSRRKQHQYNHALFPAEVQLLEDRQMLSAAFVSKSIEDHRVLANGQSFTQTIKLQNTDGKTWAGYTLSLVSGSDKLGAGSSIAVPTTAHLGTATINISGTATKTGGSRGAAQVQYWVLNDATGKTIPIQLGFTPKNSFAVGKVWTAITINGPLPNPQLIPNLSLSAYTSTVNPYLSIGNGGQCTAFCWGRAYERLGKSLTKDLGGAVAPGQWHSALKAKGYVVDMIPKAHSIAVWVKPDGRQGHVAYVESVSGSGNTAQVAFNEANVIGFSDFAGNNDANSINSQSTPNWGAGYDGNTKVLTHSQMKSRGTTFGTFMGYIHLA